LEIRVADRPELALLANVVAVATSGFLVHRDFVDPAGVGPATLCRGEDVLVEVPAVRAAQRLEEMVEVGPAVDPFRDVERDVGPRLHDLRKPRVLRQRLLTAGCELADDDRHRRRVRRAQEARIGGLGTARASDREERQSPDQPEEHHDAREAPPSPPQ